MSGSIDIETALVTYQERVAASPAAIVAGAASKVEMNGKRRRRNSSALSVAIGVFAALPGATPASAESVELEAGPPQPARKPASIAEINRTLRVLFMLRGAFPCVVTRTRDTTQRSTLAGREIKARCAPLSRIERGRGRRRERRGCRWLAQMAC